MKCEEGHFEIIFDSTLTPDCPLCKMRKKALEIAEDTFSDDAGDCCTETADLIYDKLEEEL